MKLEMINALGSPLYKGRVITREEIATYLDKDVDDIDWKDLLKVKSDIERNFDFTCRTQENGNFLYILTDEEATLYNHRQVELSIQRMFRRHRKQLQVDRTQLSENSKGAHDRRIIIQGKALQGMESAVNSNQIDYEPHERIKLPKPGMKPDISVDEEE